MSARLWRMPKTEITITASPGYLDHGSFQSQIRKTISDISRVATLTKVDGGTGPFDFIAVAAEDFIKNPISGLDAMASRFKAADRLMRLKVSKDEADYEDDETWDDVSDLIDYYDHLHRLALQIINAAITQCLDMQTDTNHDYSLSEIPWNNSVESRSEFLRTLLDRAEGLWIPTVRDSVQESSSDTGGLQCDNPDFNYGEELDSSAGNVRVAIVSPGSGDDPICCCLELRNLQLDGGLQEALSYVWGPAPASHIILVNGKDFKVRDSLYCALRHLRRPDTPREIWADALCINQADEEEKIGQIRLMRQIYASASKTTIWLGDGETEIEEDFPFEDMESSRSVTQWLDEPATKETDLKSMLVLCQTLTSELTPELKADARGKLTGEKGEKAAKIYQSLHELAILHNKQPSLTWVADVAREFTLSHMSGLSRPMIQWFHAYDSPIVVKPYVPGVDDGNSHYHLHKLMKMIGGPDHPFFDDESPKISDKDFYDGQRWVGKLMAATVFLFRCVRSILSHSWWERMWVVQESYFSKESPEFYFQGQHISWDTLVDAKDVAKDMEFGIKWNHIMSLQQELDSLSGKCALVPKIEGFLSHSLPCKGLS